MVNMPGFKNLRKFQKKARGKLPAVSSKNVVSRAPRAAKTRANAAINAALDKSAKRRAYYLARKAEKERILAMDGGEQVWQGILERRKSDYAERRKLAAQKRQNYAMGTHTKRGALRKTRMEGGNCITAAALYGEKILKSPYGKKFYWRTSKSGKRYRRYCKTHGF